MSSDEDVGLAASPGFMVTEGLFAFVTLRMQDGTADNLVLLEAGTSQGADCRITLLEPSTRKAWEGSEVNQSRENPKDPPPAAILAAALGFPPEECALPTPSSAAPLILAPHSLRPGGR